jgi:Heterokaryon incompatibility protein (HET)
VLPSRISGHVASRTHLPKEDISAPTPNDFCLYKPLNRENKDIRLLYLRPGEPDDPISCCLVTTAAEVPPFEALPYCWGSPANKAMNVSIGNLGLSGTGNDSQTQTLSITANDGTSRLLWVDAVRINQDDILERGS